jgi:hypothetical protein
MLLDCCGDNDCPGKKALDEAALMAKYQSPGEC